MRVQHLHSSSATVMTEMIPVFFSSEKLIEQCERSLRAVGPEHINADAGIRKKIHSGSMVRDFREGINKACTVHIAAPRTTERGYRFFLYDFA